jgi:plasmid stabilization system protein ParE
VIAYNIVFTKSADKDEASIYKYIAETFGEIYAERFREKLLNAILLLSRHPFVGRPARNNPSLRVLLLNKQNKLVYTIAENDLIILRLLNTRTNYPSDF